MRIYSRTNFERGVVVVSIDTEQIWGYRDSMNEAQFEQRFPDARGAHERLLAYLRATGVCATWFVVGGLALRESGGVRDPRMAGLLDESCSLPIGCETTAPLWHCPSFLERLRDSYPPQEIGLHGGLTHFIWTDPGATPDVARRELAGGVQALAHQRVRPVSFSFARNQEAYRELLPEHGIRCFRGRPSSLPWRLGRTTTGAVLRAFDELRGAPPPMSRPHEVLPGLWNIPASMFLYPIGPTRARVIPLHWRVERFSCGLRAAARRRAIFHFSLHPENLAESPHGFSLLDEILGLLARARDRGDVEILTLSDVVARLEGKQPSASLVEQGRSAE